MPQTPNQFSVIRAGSKPAARQKTKFLTIVTAVSSLILTVALGFSQGILSPTGAPAPTIQSLVHIEPSRGIPSAPFSVILPIAFLILAIVFLVSWSAAITRAASKTGGVAKTEFIPTSLVNSMIWMCLIGFLIIHQGMDVAWKRIVHPLAAWSWRNTYWNFQDGDFHRNMQDANELLSQGFSGRYDPMEDAKQAGGAWRATAYAGQFGEFMVEILLVTFLLTSKRTGVFRSSSMAEAAAKTKEAAITRATAKAGHPVKLLDRMVEAKQLTDTDAGVLSAQVCQGKPELIQSEGSVLCWLATEYHLNFTTLDKIEPDFEVLALLPAHWWAKEGLFPVQRISGVVHVATSRLFATPGLDNLRSLTGLKIQPVLAPAEAIRRELTRYASNPRCAEGANSHELMNGQSISFPIRTAAAVALWCGAPAFLGGLLALYSEWGLSELSRTLPVAVTVLIAGLGGIAVLYGILNLRLTPDPCPTCSQLNVEPFPKQDTTWVNMFTSSPGRYALRCRNCGTTWLKPCSRFAAVCEIATGASFLAAGAWALASGVEEAKTLKSEVWEGGWACAAVILFAAGLSAKGMRRLSKDARLATILTQPNEEVINNQLTRGASIPR